MGEIVPPPFITYAPDRMAGTWRMHETVGHLRNSIRNSRGCVRKCFRLNADGTWTEFDPDDAFREDFS